MGNLWIANLNRGLLRLSPDLAVDEIPWARMGHRDFAAALAADPVRGGLWLGFHRGGVAYFADGEIRASYAARNGLGEGRVNWLRSERGTLWAGTEGGLSRLKDGRIATLTSKNGLPCDAVSWAMEDDAHSLWLLMACGLAGITRSELDAWAADPERTINATVLDSSDGVISLANPAGYRPRGGKSADGKLWFTTAEGVSVVDPAHIPINQLVPPVNIEQITADRKTYYDTAANVIGPVRLPALVRDVQIDYTALSLVAPERVKFRYRLEGHETEWQDVGPRRQAFYNDLRPRKYRFRVIACNNSGLWNEAGASLDFSVAPAYYQTTWFLAACIAASLGLLAAVYSLRVRYVKQQFNMRLEERVGERTRIARDLHDTLLQSFQGVLLKFHAVTFALPHHPDEARDALENAIEEARQAIAEGRDAVQGLRSSAVPTEDLARAIGTLGEGLAADQNGGQPTGFRVHVEGAPRKLRPMVRDEVYRIAGEGLRNAFRHACASRIEVDIHYDKRQLVVRVRDDGKGIDPHVLDEGGRAGHHGLPGMHERAKLVGGTLTIWSKLDSGTEAELAIPGPVAYAKLPGARRSIFSRKGAE